MPVPTITSISPSSGAPTGGLMVEIVGTGFRMPTIPISGRVGELAPSVLVTLGGVPARLHTVASPTRLFFLTPKATLLGPPPDVQPIDSLRVALQVRNIDGDGVMIPGELVTVPDAFTYRRPDVSIASTSSLALASMTLRRLLASETIGNVVLETNVDFDDDTFSESITAVATVPAIVLSGPKIQEDAFNARRDDIHVTTGNEYRSHRPGRSVTLGYEYVIVSQNSRQLQNIMNLVAVVLDRNQRIQIDGVLYDMDAVADPSSTRQPETSLKANVRAASGRIAIRGYPLEALPGFDRDGERGGGARVDDDEDAILIEPMPRD